MDNEQDNIVESENNEQAEENAEEVAEVKEEPKKEKPKLTPEEELKRLEGRAKRLRKDLGLDVEPKKQEEKSTHTGELDDTQLDYLDLKGITEDEDIAVIKSVMSKTGQTLRQTLKDDYVIAKLKDLKVARDVKTATPSASKRSGQQATDNEDYWYQKYEASGELPKGMPAGMAIKLVTRKEAENDVHTPKFGR